MRVILLVAGASQRLRPLTDHMPKCLLSVGGRTIASRAIEILSSHGLRRFTVVDGYQGEKLRAALTGEFPVEWFTFVRNDDYATTNNAYSLMLARYEADEPMLMLDGDVLFDPAVIGRLLADPRPNRLALQRHAALDEEGMKVRLDRDGRVTDISKAIPVTEAAGESLGIEVFSADFARRLFATLERRQLVEKRLNEWYESAFLELVERGEAIYCVDVGDLAGLEVDTIEDLERARALFGRRDSKEQT